MRIRKKYPALQIKEFRCEGGLIEKVMDSVIEHIDQVTPEWLTSAFKKSGYLQQGEVASFSKEQSYLEGFTSERYHLELVYTENVPKSAPAHLFLKIGTSSSFKAV